MFHSCCFILNRMEIILLMKTVVDRDVTLYSLEGTGRRFRGPYYFLHQGDGAKKPSEMSVSFY